MILVEKRKEDDIYFQGPFWIIANSQIDIQKGNFTLLSKLIPVDYNGNYLDDSKGTKGFTSHKKLWNEYQLKYNVEYDYYPRGRVEISRGIVTVYHSPHIPQDELKQWLIDKFNLTTHNGIKKIKMIADGSEHYSCYLDN